ncbi:unnamed protein product, partial [marine sediment metagenome]
ARIFIERALEEKRLPAAMAKEAAEALARYSRSKLFSVGDHQYQPDFTDGWRKRTRQLYATAARVAAALARREKGSKS